MTSPDATSLQQTLNYHFTNTQLLEEALTHPSVQATRRPKKQDYQRLEFLGDAVLGLVVADMLFALYPHEREGDLAKRKGALVSGKQLVEVASSWNLGAYLRLSGRADATGGRTIATNIEDACEAVIGAIYLDGGLDAARQVIHTFWYALAQKPNTPPKDAKTALQEWAQGRGLPLPDYEVVERKGPAHEPLFTVQVSVDGQEPHRAEGASKRSASTRAAKSMLASIKNPDA